MSKPRLGQLEEILGTRVRIVEKTEQRGRIEIEYYSQDDLQRLYGLIAKDVLAVLISKRMPV